MVVVLCYDVSDDGRRAKLFKKLKAYLTPVQESVFEGHLPPSRFGRLVAEVRDTIDPALDSVRVYHLCRGCRGQTLLVGTSPPVREPDAPILV